MAISKSTERMLFITLRYELLRLNQTTRRSFGGNCCHQALSLAVGFRRVLLRVLFPCLFMMVRCLLLVPLLLVACQAAPTERADTLVDLATVQSGPRVQADELNGAIALEPRNTALLARRATLRLAAGQAADALRDVQAALAIDAANAEFYFLQARAYRALGQLPAALAAARQAAERGFGGPELPLLVGETHLAARNYPAALDNLDRTLRLDPDQPAALFYKGLAYAATADTSTAVQYLQDALARSPREPEILHQLAFLLNAWRVPAEAARHAALGLKLDTTSGLLHYDYGRQLELQGFSDSAQWYYRRALALDTPCTGPTTAWVWPLPRPAGRPWPRCT